MFALHKNYFYISILLLSSLPLISEEDPYIFIDSNAQKMVQVLIENKDLFSKDREAYEDKIKEIFDPMIDFRRVAASVMGKNTIKLLRQSKGKILLQFLEILY
jgi:phospholipid transport system substrate-binding protein